MANGPAWTVSGNTLTMFLNDVQTITSSHPNFQRILTALKACEDPTPLLDPDAELRRFLGPGVKVSSLHSKTRAVAVAMIASGYPRMAACLESFNLWNSLHYCFAEIGIYPVTHAGPVIDGHSYFGNRINLLEVGLGSHPKWQSPPLDLAHNRDGLVFEQILCVFRASAEIHIRTSYRTLIFDEATFPIQGELPEVSLGGRYLTGPGVEVSINFLRNYCLREEV
jgi:hypothetical protein